jgi:hypothetical protein
MLFWANLISSRKCHLGTASGLTRAPCLRGQTNRRRGAGRHTSVVFPSPRPVLRACPNVPKGRDIGGCGWMAVDTGWVSIRAGQAPISGLTCTNARREFPHGMQRVRGSSPLSSTHITAGQTGSPAPSDRLVGSSHRHGGPGHRGDPALARSDQRTGQRAGCHAGSVTNA